MRIPAGIAAVIVVVALIGPPLAAGHTELVGSSPADGARLDVAPQIFALRFAQPIASASEVSVIGPSGNELARDVRRDPGDATRVLVNLGFDGGGTYSVRWSILSSDGDAVSGDTEYIAARGSLVSLLGEVTQSLRQASGALLAASERLGN